MKSRLLGLLLCISFIFIISLPALSEAQITFHQEDLKKPPIQWRKLPAPLQTLKNQLDRIRKMQKKLFDKMRSQNQQIIKMRSKLTAEQHEKMKQPTRKLVHQLKVNQEEMQLLHSQNHNGWRKFHYHTEEEQWPLAKMDLTQILQQQKKILGLQQGNIQLQKKLLTLLNSFQQSAQN